MAAYEGTNITEEKVVNHLRTQLNDALNAFLQDSINERRKCKFLLAPNPLLSRPILASSLLFSIVIDKHEYMFGLKTS